MVDKLPFLETKEKSKITAVAEFAHLIPGHQRSIGKEILTYLFTSESVSEGHPDKLCDMISDAILDECLSIDSEARVAVETMVKGTDSGSYIFIGGEIQLILFN